MSYGNQSGGYGQPPENGGYGSSDPKGSSGGYPPPGGYGYPADHGPAGGYGSPGGYGPAGGYDPSGGYGPQQDGYGPAGHDPYGGYGGYGGYGPPPSRPNNGMAIAALIMGICGLIACGVPSVVGAVLGHISLGQINRTGEDGRGMAITGLVLSYIGIACWVGFLVLWLVLVGTLGGAALLNGG
ncbi:DUF4190 domain-containing protein [Streptosporangium sp. NPDC023615]|uniref:DUF4190 domain-containing protein n=1 Tax=Streptosporangium sp. NPDC023615 TaxID=3154794 RepID=UPI00342ED80D